MNFHFSQTNQAFPIVEFCDVRTEKFRTDRYLALEQDELSVPLAMSGVAMLAHFTVESQPDRLLALRGYSSVVARRKALTAFHAGPDWSAHRRQATDLTRSAEVILTRAVAPSAGIAALRPATGYQLVVSELRFPAQIGNYHLWLRLFLRKAGLDPLAAFATLETANDVPAVPVVRNRTQHVALLPAGAPPPELPPELRAMVRFAPETLGLEPARLLVA